MGCSEVDGMAADDDENVRNKETRRHFESEGAQGGVDHMLEAASQHRKQQGCNPISFIAIIFCTAFTML